MPCSEASFAAIVLRNTTHYVLSAPAPLIRRSQLQRPRRTARPPCRRAQPRGRKERASIANNTGSSCGPPNVSASLGHGRTVLSGLGTDASDPPPRCQRRATAGFVRRVARVLLLRWRGPADPSRIRSKGRTANARPRPQPARRLLTHGSRRRDNIRVYGPVSIQEKRGRSDLVSDERGKR
jgi:hypothetical protein